MGLFDTLKKISSNGGKGHKVDDLLATIGKRGGIAKPNRFVVIMTPPAASLINTDIGGLVGQALSGNLGLNDFVNDPRDIAMLCRSCSIPGRTINTLEYANEGYKNQVKVPYSYTNEDVSFQFLLTNDYYMKKQFDKWMSLVIDPELHTIPYRTQYTSDVIIQQLDQDNNPVYGVKLIGAYPTAINSVSLDNNASDQIQELQVTMTYTDLEPEGPISSIVSGLKEVLDFSLF
jgi:hypothetical protein